MPHKLTMRLIRVSDVAHVMTWVNDPEVVKNFQNFDKKFTRTEERAFLRRLVASPTDRTFSLFRTEDKAYVGQCALNQISGKNKVARPSLFIRRKYWGKGYGQEAMRLLMDYAFRTLKLHKVWLMVYASNKKALHMYRKLGFKNEGHLRKEYFWRGKYHDIVRMGLLAKDFKE